MFDVFQRAALQHAQVLAWGRITPDFQICVLHHTNDDDHKAFILAKFYPATGGFSFESHCATVDECLIRFIGKLGCLGISDDTREYEVSENAS